MSHFVANHIRMRKLARRAQLLSHYIEKRQVQIDDPVARTVEGTCCCLTESAGGGVAVPEQPELRFFVGHTSLLERRGPHLFSATENLRHEMSLCITGRRRLGCLIR